VADFEVLFWTLTGGPGENHENIQSEMSVIGMKHHFQDHFRLTFCLTVSTHKINSILGNL
jgi:hypothetical protein